MGRKLVLQLLFVVTILAAASTLRASETIITREPVDGWAWSSGMLSSDWGSMSSASVRLEKDTSIEGVGFWLGEYDLDYIRASLDSYNYIDVLVYEYGTMDNTPGNGDELYGWRTLPSDWDYVEHKQVSPSGYLAALYSIDVEAETFSAGDYHIVFEAGADGSGSGFLHWMLTPTNGTDDMTGYSWCKFVTDSQWVAMPVNGPDYKDMSILVEGMVIPVPGALLLGGIGFGLVGWLRRRGRL